MAFLFQVIRPPSGGAGFGAAEVLRAADRTWRGQHREWSAARLVW